jgi:hypothetical protein
MLASTIPVSILGVQFAMRVFPFWTPAQYSEYCYPFPGVSFARTDTRHLIVPVVGMLCGNAIGGVLVSMSFILKELE